MANRRDADNFLIPATPVPPKKRAGRAKRDIGKEILAVYGNREAFLAAGLTFDREHFRPLAPSTMRKLGEVKRMYLSFMIEALGSEEAALATLTKGAEPPSLHLLKQFLHFCATQGKSALGIQGVVGWSSVTTKVFLGRVLTMRSREGCLPLSKESYSQMLSAVAEWVKGDKAINTMRRTKVQVRREDCAELLQAILKSSNRIASNFLRVQMCLFATLLYYTGQRPGTIVDSNNYEGLGQHLKWGHIELIIDGYDEGLGLQLKAFVQFHYMKNMRDDDAEFVNVYITSSGRENMHLDTLLYFFALGIYRGVFTENALELFTRDVDKLPPFPHTFLIKPEFQDAAVFMDFKKEKAWTMHGVQKLFQKVTRSLKWRFFTLYSFRIGFAGYMANTIPRNHLQYFMGHRSGSNLAYSTYQSVHRPVDLTAIRTGEVQDLALSELRGSVAWDRDKAREAPTDNNKYPALDDATLQALIKVLTTKETLVREKYGCTSDKVPLDNLNDDLVTAALNAWCDVMTHYADLQARGNQGHLPVHVKTVLNRKESGEPISVHRPRQQRSASVTSVASTSSMSVASMDEDGGPSRSTSAMSTRSNPQRGRSATVNSNPRGRSASAMSTTSAASSSAMSVEPTELPPISVTDEILDILASIDDTHPFQLIIDNEPHNPRLIVIMRLLALLKADEYNDEGTCAICVSVKGDKAKSTKQHVSNHAWTCEAEQRPKEWRCPVCADFVPIGDDDLFEDEQASIEEIQDDHFSACYETLLAKLELVKATDACDSEPSDTDDEEDDDAKGKVKAVVKLLMTGIFSLTISSRIAHSRRLLTRIFCPVCLFDTSLPWQKRFMYEFAAERMYQHLHSHWSKAAERTGINYKKKFKCHYPPCAGDCEFDTGAFITHLHKAHNYDLVQCSRPHPCLPDCEPVCSVNHHTAKCDLSLSDQFAYITDAETALKFLGIAIPPVSLVDHRRSRMKKTAMKKNGDVPGALPFGTTAVEPPLAPEPLPSTAVIDPVLLSSVAPVPAPPSGAIPSPLLICATQTAGTRLKIADFAVAHNLPEAVLLRFQEHGFCDTDAFSVMTTSDLTDLGFKMGEVFAVKAAIKKWAVAL